MTERPVLPSRETTSQMVLVDQGLTERFNFTAPVAASRHILWLCSPTADEQAKGQSYKDRLFDVLLLANVAVKKGETSFGVFLGGTHHSLVVQLNSQMGEIEITEPDTQIKS